MVKVDKEKCLGCGLCVEICEEIFEIEKDGKAGIKKNKNVPGIKDAMMSCPTSAIKE